MIGNRKLERKSTARCLLRRKSRERHVEHRARRLEWSAAEGPSGEGGGVGVGAERRFCDACDVGGGEAVGQGLRGQGGGAGGEKLEKKSMKEAKHKQGGFEGKSKEEAVEKIKKRPSS